MDAFLVILFRWLHIVPAAIAIGGLFVMRFVLPAGLSAIAPDQAKTVFLRCRRVFKISIHASIFFLLVSGAYNSWANWNKYRVVPHFHAFYDSHVLFGVIAMVVALIILAPKEPPASHKRWATVNFVLLLLAVAAAGSLKWARDHAPQITAPTTPAAPASVER